MRNKENKLKLSIRLRLKYLSLKRRLKKIKIDKEKATIKFFIGLAFVSIIIGLFIFLFFLHRLSNEYTFTTGQIELDKTGQVGDFIGGVIGAIWALTGVLLFYATLRLQSRELSENRKHFQISRLTDIIYKQLDLYNNQLSEFQLKDVKRDSSGENIGYKGKAAISLLKERIEFLLNIDRDEQDADKKKGAMITYMAENFAFIDINSKELEGIYEELSNHLDVIRAVLIKEGIPPSDLNELKSIFFRNIGRDFLNSTELFIQFLDQYISFKKNQGQKVDPLFSSEEKIKRKIESIIDFRNKVYTTKMINEYLRHRDIYNDTTF